VGDNHNPATSWIKAKVACCARVVGRCELTAVVNWMCSVGSETGLTEKADGRTERMTALRGSTA
jgi:hypothetical protein